MQTSIAFHYPCTDGIFAAFLARTYYPDATLIPITHGRPYELPRTGKVIFLDVTPLCSVVPHSIEFEIYDHHDSAKTEILKLKQLNQPSKIIFDLGKSGAMLALDEFKSSNPFLTRLVEYVDARDRWVKDFPNCDVMSSALYDLINTSKSPDSALLDIQNILDNHTESSLLQHGQDICNAHNKIIQYEVRHHNKATMMLGDKTYNVGFSEARMLRSDIAAEILVQNPQLDFSFCWSYFKGKIQLSLRSNEKHMDISVIAKTLGGGGLRNAAGCEIDSADVSKYFKDITHTNYNHNDIPRSDFIKLLNPFTCILETDESKKEIKVYNIKDVLYSNTTGDDDSFILTFNIQKQTIYLSNQEKAYECELTNKDPLTFRIKA